MGGVSAAISSYKSTGRVNLGSVLLGAGVGAVGGVIGASGIPAVGQSVASGLLSAANNIGTAMIQKQKIDWLDVGIDAVIGAGGSAVGSWATKKISDAAEAVIKKGVKRSVSGVSKLKGGSRYWKGSIKRGVSIMRQGVKSLNTARGKASVIGSSISGGASILKTGIYAILGR